MEAVPIKLLEWSAEYSFHSEEFDREHQLWFDLVNRLHQAMLAGKGVELLQTLAHELIAHTLAHFAHEEQLMVAVNYPDFAAHAQIHQEFRGTAAVFMQRFERGDTTMTIELLHFLSEAVPQHIMTNDRQLAEYLTAHSSFTMTD